MLIAIEDPTRFISWWASGENGSFLDEGLASKGVLGYEDLDV